MKRPYGILSCPRRNAELLHVCTSGRQFKAQKENWLISGLQDQRWKAEEMVWSIRPNKQLDRAGVGTTSRFFHLPYTTLENLVYFSLLIDTYSQASGKLWSRTGAIPMGGPFSAQSADLRSIWGVQQHTHLMGRMGNLSFSPRGHPLWTTPRGNVLSLAQFRDNVLVGPKGLTA